MPQYLLHVVDTEIVDALEKERDDAVAKYEAVMLENDALRAQDTQSGER